MANVEIIVHNGEQRYSVELGDDLQSYRNVTELDTLLSAAVNKIKLAYYG